MERPAPIHSSWVTLRSWSTTQRRATYEGAGHEEGTICRSRCPCGNDRDCRGRVRWRRATARRDRQPTESIRKLVNRLGPAEQLRVCYEAGPTGYVLDWQLCGA